LFYICKLHKGNKTIAAPFVLNIVINQSKHYVVVTYFVKYAIKKIQKNLRGVAIVDNNCKIIKVDKIFKLY
jgi:hypothetical protein